MNYFGEKEPVRDGDAYVHHQYCFFRNHLGIFFESAIHESLALTDSHKIDYPINVIVQPEEETLIEYYQKADFLLFTSWYEGVGMPPLEAMACHTAVIATKCGGVDESAIHEFNCLLADPGDVGNLVKHAEALMNNPELRERLAGNGRKTAVNYRYKQIIPLLEDYMKTLLENKKRVEMQKQPER